MWIKVTERLPEEGQRVLVIQNPKTTATREPLAEKSKDSIKLIDKKVKLEFELSDLRNELYHIERKKVS